jgi:hypothetical protein
VIGTVADDAVTKELHPTEKERRLGGCVRMLVSHGCVASQNIEGGHMNRDQSVLVQLSATNDKDSFIEIDVRYVKSQDFTKTQATTRAKSKHGVKGMI